MELKVNISDYKSVSSPEDSLITIGLGSCIGIALYDSHKNIAGLAHIMLPYSKDFRDNDKPAKFADTCIPLLIEEMEYLGARRRNITAKIAGGANMFNIQGETIGEKNANAVIATLKELNIPIIAQDLGGNIGRTVSIHSINGEVYVRKIGASKVLL